MNRELFKEQFDAMREANHAEIARLLRRNLTLDDPEVKEDIAKEEAAELIIEISKFTRHKGNRIGLLEEMADVYICLWNIRQIHNLTNDELERAILVKLRNYSELREAELSKQREFSKKYISQLMNSGNKNA